MDTDIYSYEDLILVENFVKLQRALEDFTSVSPNATVLERYLHLCKLYNLRPSTAYEQLLREQDKQKATTCGDNELGEASVTGTATGSNTSEGRLSFAQEYMGVTLLLPILVTLPECANGLRVLDLSRCNLSSAAVQLLCYKALANSRTIREIDISGNPSCGPAGVEALLQLALRSPNVCSCRIAGVPSIGPLSRRLEEALARNCARAAQVALASAETAVEQ